LAVAALLGAALMLSPAAIASGPKAHAAAYHFSGKTSQNGGFEMLLSSSLRKTTVHFQYQVTCASGLSFPDEQTGTVRNTAVFKSGHHISRLKFDATGQFTVSATSPTGAPVSGSSSVHLAGKIRLDTGNANGRIEADVTLSNGDKCTSGNSPVTWTASVD
jgi:hypothetical protein